MIMNIKIADLQNKFGKKAKEYANDKERTGKLINDAVDKADNLDKSGPMETLSERLQLLFGVVKDWANGSYKDVPKGSIIVIIIGLLYFLSPFDLIPDFIPGGYLDDAFVLALIIKQVNSDLEKYKNWKQENQVVHHD
jgi:uncharacterized membrane protein YkvA (DUF1232 family)